MNPLDVAARHPRAAALLGALAITFSGIFYRWSAVDPSTGVVFRCLYGLPLLALAAWWERRTFGTMGPRTVRLAVLAGLFFAVDLLTFHYVVDNIGAGLATVMGNLQVLIVGLAAWLLWGERPRREVLVALPIMLGGVVLIAGVVGGDAYGVDAPAGVAIGLVTAASYAGYLLVIRRASPDRRPAGPVAIATAVTALAAGGFGAAAGTVDFVPSWPAHGWLLLLGLTSQGVGYLMIQVSLPRLPAVLTSLILLVQPVATVLFAWLLLAETPSPGQLTGVALVIGGLAIATVPHERLRSALAMTSIRD